MFTTRGGFFSSSGPQDTYWGYVGSLMHGDNGLFDEVTQANRTAVGSDVYTSTTQSKFGGSSIYFNNNDRPQNGTDSYISIGANSAFTMGTSDFTIEGWVYASRTSGLNAIVDFRSAGNSISPSLFIYDGRWASYANGWLFDTGTVSTNTWYHFALCRKNNITKLFIDGTQVASVFDNREYTATNGLRVGAGWNASDGFYGYIDELRITKDIARYTAAFTPSTTAFPNQGPARSIFAQTGLLLDLRAWDSTSYPGSGTSWLDLSGLNNTATLVNGPTYSSTPNNGVITLDGVNDYITTPVGYQEYYTIEYGFSVTSVPTGTRVQAGHYDGTGDQIYIGISAGKLSWYDNVSQLDTTTVVANTFYHVSCVSGPNGKIMYVNGTNVGTMSAGVAYPNGNWTFGRLGSANSNYAPGRYSYFRIYRRPLTSADISANYSASAAKV